MLTIRLLGPPALDRDGRPAPSPRGHKAWAVLAYLLLTDRPVARQHLAELLFGDADDPLGALRWTLAELRRCLGDVVAGDPIVTRLGPDVRVDIADRDFRDLTETSDGELLEGVAVRAAPGFDAWLLLERHRVSAAVEGRLRHAAVGLLAAGRADEAVPLASRAVARNPLDEGNHEVLVRCLAASGDRPAALRAVHACEDVLRRELDTKPSAAVRDAAAAVPGSAAAPARIGRAAAVSQLDAGRAAIAAGAVDAGLQCLRRAVAEAAGCDDQALRARALTALGGALVHAVRGRDEEGAVVLREALRMASRAGDRATAVTAHRELGFVEVQAGRRATADEWLANAQGLAETDEELAAIAGVRGMNASDLGDYPAAYAFLDESVERAERCGDQRQQAWSLSLVGRAHLLRGDPVRAADALGATMELVARQRWLAFQPWPQAFQAQLQLSAGDPAGAADTLEGAWTLACQIADPCWEGLAARGLGLTCAARGDHDTATRWLDEAARRCNRVPDRYQWLHGYILVAAITTALDRDDTDRARPLVTTLAALAARCDMREFAARAHAHGHRLGDPTALASARLLAAGIDNPALTALFDRFADDQRSADDRNEDRP